MSDTTPSPNPTDPGKRTRSVNARVFGAVLSIVLLGVLVVSLTLGRSIVESTLLNMVNGALQPALTVERVQIDTPTRLTLWRVQGSGVSMRAARVHFSPWVALRGDLVTAIERIDLIEPVAQTAGDLGSPELSLHTVHRLLKELPKHTALLSEYVMMAPEHDDLSIHIDGGRLSAEEGALAFDGRLSSHTEGDGYALAVSLAARDGSMTAKVNGAVSSEEVRLQGLELDWGHGKASVVAEAVGERLSGSIHVHSIEEAAVQLEQLRLDFECEGLAARCAGAIEAQQGRLAHHPIAHLTGKFAIDGDRWRVTEFAARGPSGSEFEATGHIEFSNDAWTAASEVIGRRVQVIEALGWVGVQPELLAEVEGTLAGRVDLSMDSDGMRVTADLNTPAIHFADALLRDVQFDVEVADGASRGTGQFELGSGRVRVPQISVSATGVMGEILIEGVAAPDLARAARGVGVRSELVHAVGGRLNGAVTVQGASLDTLEAIVHANADRLSYRSTQLAPLRLDGVWQADGSWSLDRFELMGVRGRAGGTSFADFTLDAEWEAVTLARLHSLIDWSPLQHLKGITSGEASARVTHEGVTGNGTVQASLETKGSPLEITGEVRLESPNDIAWRGSAQAAGGALIFDGSWSPDPRKQRVNAKLSEFPAAALAEIARLPDVQGTLSGSVEAHTLGSSWDVTAQLSSPELLLGSYRMLSTALSVDVSGPVDPQLQSVCSRCLYGESSLHAQVTKGGRAGGDLGTLGFRVTFSGREAILDTMALPFLDGWVTAAGQATLSDNDEWELDVQSTGRGLQHQDGGVALNVDYDLGLTGPLAAPALAGRVQTSSGEIDLLRLAGGQLDRSNEGALDRIALNLEVDIRNVYIVARSLVDAEVGGVLDVKGSLAQPAIFGQIEARRGLFRYGPTRFDIEEATATFAGGSLVPQLNVIGAGRVDRRRVEAHVNGPADALRLKLLVDGVEDSQGALGLLGPRWTESENRTGWRELGMALLGWLDDEFVSEAYWQVGRALERTFDLDRFRIEPDQENGGMQLDMGKYLTPELYLSYRRSLSEAGSDGVGLEYLLAPGVRLRTDWGDEERPDVGLELRLPF